MSDAFPELGALVSPEGTTFRAWATRARDVAVRLARDGAPPEDRPLAPRGGGVFDATFADVAPGALYTFVLDGRELPDPYARVLPRGVHGPAEVALPLAPAAPRAATPLEGLVIYELHVGAFTREGTYRAAMERLSYLADLGVTALELMPVAAFPGARGWGYDGVAGFAPYAPYGAREELRELVARAHDRGLAVLLDVVYNHFGPRGNYLGAYAPEYFTADACNPWGCAPDFSTPAMRAYALRNARMWLDEYGFDGLRLDATHAIADPSPTHVLEELARLAHGLTPRRLVIAEDERNEPALVTRAGLDAVWADDFHHQVRVLLTGEREGYYAAYEPTVRALARAIARGWTYEGQTYAPRGAPRGKPADGLAPAHLVYCIQNHDQIGNRPLGTRLSDDVEPARYRAVTVLLGFLPSTPLLFMGQEWGASTPFLYFTDHDEEHGPRVSAGRREELKAFAAFREPSARAKVPDPQDAATFARSKLAWDERAREPHRSMLETTRAILRLRRADPVLAAPARFADLDARAEGEVLVVERRAGGDARTLVVNFGRDPAIVAGGRALLASTPPASERVPPAHAVIFEGRARLRR